MSRLSRNLTFQLTPLLDLLLIVIFAQYMEVQQSTQHQEATFQRQTVRMQRQGRQLQDRLAAAEQQIDRLRREYRELEQQKSRAEEALQRSLQQQERLGDLTAQLFQLPEPLIDKAVEWVGSASEVRSPQQAERLRKAFQAAAEKRGREVVKHLLTFQELRKQCDIWELHIAENGQAELKAQEVTKSFRFRPGMPEEPALGLEEAADRFANRLFDAYRTLPQPKNLVIILFTYEMRTPRYWRKPALMGLRRATRWMQDDAEGAIRFRYTDIGIF